MSYDAYIVIDTGSDELSRVAEIGNYTSNVSHIWSAVLGCRLRDLDGRAAKDVIPLLEKAVAALHDPDKHRLFKKMEPDNGWGSLDGATRYLEKILQACRKHPRAQLSISS